MKKLLLLGGSTQQIPAIVYAKEKGYTTILCDYLPNNPGQKYVDKFYCVSTTHKEAILKIARKEKIDGIVAYASDPAAPTAAYVAECLDLPTNPYKSVKVLALKDKFRQFLKEHDFNYPKADVFNDLELAKKGVKDLYFPLMVKPTDSSGSKGVQRIVGKEDLEEAFRTAFSLSRSKNVIIEEYIEKNHPHIIGGDCFVIDGVVEFWGLLNCHRDNNVSPLVPVGKSYPLLQIEDKKLLKIYQTIQKVVDLLDIKFGGFNLELMFDQNDDLYIIEMGPRNGGNMIPDLLKMVTGVDMASATVEQALGHKDFVFTKATKEVYYATHNIHSVRNGTLKKVTFSPKLEKYIIKNVTFKEPGDKIEYFDSSNKALGIIFMEFPSLREMNNIINNINNLIEIELSRSESHGTE